MKKTTKASASFAAKWLRGASAPTIEIEDIYGNTLAVPHRVPAIVPLVIRDIMRLQAGLEGASPDDLAECGATIIEALCRGINSVYGPETAEGWLARGASAEELMACLGYIANGFTSLSDEDPAPLAGAEAAG
jgi:hypothetical protein